MNRFYVLHCFLPHDRYVEVLDNCVVESKIFARNEELDFLEFVSSNGLTKDLTCDEIGNLFSFVYTSHLTFLHEKDLRNIISEIPDSKLLDQIFKINDFDCNLLMDGAVNKKLSIRSAGVRYNVNIGIGVFAKELIDEGEFIGEYTGVVCGNKNYTNSDYALLYPAMDDGLEINALEYGNITRFINHSINPNAEFRRIFVNDVIHVICVSNLKHMDFKKMLCILNLNYKKLYIID
jgi:hypothetical protein